jgi:hypothetical protein
MALQMGAYLSCRNHCRLLKLGNREDEPVAMSAMVRPSQAWRARGRARMGWPPPPPFPLSLLSMAIDIDESALEAPCSLGTLEDFGTSASGRFGSPRAQIFGIRRS